MTAASTTGGPMLAFDLYGTLVDPIGISDSLGQMLWADDASGVARLWRATQLEYAFRLTVMGRYEDFGWVTARALDFALEVLGHRLSAADRHKLLDEYSALAPFPDALPGLQLLQEANVGMAVLSNGTPEMIDECLEHSGLAPYFQTLISVDEVRAYKPHASVYEHAAGRMNHPVEAISLVSCNLFDIAGAQSAGMRTTWLNRSGGPLDALADTPDVVVSSLLDLSSAAVLSKLPGAPDGARR